MSLRHLSSSDILVGFCHVFAFAAAQAIVKQPNDLAHLRRGHGSRTKQGYLPASGAAHC